VVAASPLRNTFDETQNAKKDKIKMSGLVFTFSFNFFNLWSNIKLLAKF
jgi:hypothetical protein